MASAWGLSWGGAWGASWGAAEQPDEQPRRSVDLYRRNVYLYKERLKMAEIQAMQKAAMEVVEAPDQATEAVKQRKLDELQAEISWNQAYTQILEGFIEQYRTEAIRSQMILLQLIAEEQEQQRQAMLEEEQAVLMLMADL